MEEELSTLVIQYWAEGVWTGTWSHEQKEAWMRQIREVQTWTHVRGLAGAVMCETRDLGIKWPYWHTLVFSDEIKIDMRCVCPRDVEKMLVQRARSVCWKKRAAKHEHEELKEGERLEPALALFCERKSGKWRTCGLSVVQLDYDDGELEPLHGMYGSMEAQLEVQRTIKRAELT